MENIVDIVTKFINLTEAVFLQFRNKIFNMLLALGMILIAGVLILMGLIIFSFGIYLGFKMFMPEYWAAFADSVLIFIVAGGLLLWAKRKMS